MFTPDSLLDIAITAEAIYKDTTSPDVRSRAWTLRERAMACADWLDNQKVKEMSHVGPFGDVPFKKGQKVRVKKGAIIHSMNPSKKTPYPAGTNYVVTVDHVYEGYVHTHRDLVVHPPVVEWAGAGGYWCGTHPNNLELVQDLTDESN